MKNNLRHPDFSPAGLLLAAMLVLVSAVSCGRSAEQSLNQAAEAWHAGDYDLAVEEYGRYLRDHPTGSVSDDVRFKLANINFLNLRKHELASSLYRAFLDHAPLHPEAPVARERLAECLAEMGKSYEAIAQYEELAAEDPKNRRIRLRIADLYHDQRNYSQALTEYEKVTSGVPYDELSEQAHLREAAVYHLARSEYDQALSVYEKLANQTAEPEVRRRALLGISDCHAGLYHFDQAIQTLHQLKDPADQSYITKRASDLETQKKEMARIPEMRWQPKRSVAEADAEARAKKQLEDSSKTAENAVPNRQKQN